MASIKQRYSAKELADMGLEGLPTSKVGVAKLALRENWAFVDVDGNGGKRREYTPPAPVLNLIKARLLKDVMGTAIVPVANLPAAATPSEQHLSAQQAQTEGARRAVLLAIDRLVEKAGVSREAAMTSILTAAKAGTLDEHIEVALRIARDNRGGKGELYPSIRTIKGWRAAALDGDSLAPAGRKTMATIPVWAKSFLEFYQQPQKPSVATAYEMFIESESAAVQKLLQNGQGLPSIHQCRRLIDKMGNVSREVGRMGSHDIRNIKGFKRRKSGHMQPNDVWTADGHKFDAEVAHPVHKRAMRPEVTVILDVATRKVVGWSIGLAESGFAVLDAIRHGVVGHGLPALFYVDNGSGYKNELMLDQAVGLMGRLGVEMENSIAYNSQARGVIESFHKNLIKAAQKMPTFIGDKMDRQAKLLAYKVTRKAIKNADTATPLMPWETFIQYIQSEMDRYNDKPHRTLKGLSPNQMWAHKVAAGFEAMPVNEAEAAYLFRPQMERSVQRCEVSLFGNKYYAKELEEYHRDRVKVAYDIHDGTKVWIYSMDDQLICTAEFEANATEYFAQSAIEYGKDKRLAGREKRVLLQLDEVQAERGKNLFVEMGQAQELEIPGLMSADKQAFAYVEPDNLLKAPLKTIEAAPSLQQVASGSGEFVPVDENGEPLDVRDMSPDERICHFYFLGMCQERGAVLTKRDAYWLGSYPKTPEYKVLHARCTKEVERSARMRAAIKETNGW